MKVWVFLAFALSGCAMQVYHPTKTRAEQERDIKTCSDHGKLSEPLEPVAALNVAHECLEKKGYRRGKAQVVAPQD